MTPTLRRILAPWHDASEIERQEKTATESEQRLLRTVQEAGLVTFRAVTVARRLQ